MDGLPLKHIYRFRVGYNETDQMGYAHHSCHLVWFEKARTELLRAKGFTYREVEEHGVMLPVREARIRYHAPARYDDELEVEARLEEMAGVRCKFQYSVRRLVDDRRIADGEVDLVFCDLSGKPTKAGLRLFKEMARKNDNTRN